MNKTKITSIDYDIDDVIKTINRMVDGHNIRAQALQLLIKYESPQTDEDYNDILEEVEFLSKRSFCKNVFRQLDAIEKGDGLLFASDWLQLGSTVREEIIRRAFDECLNTIGITNSAHTRYQVRYNPFATTNV